VLAQQPTYSRCAQACGCQSVAFVIPVPLRNSVISRWRPTSILRRPSTCRSPPLSTARRLTARLRTRTWHPLVVEGHVNHLRIRSIAPRSERQTTRLWLARCHCATRGTPNLRAWPRGRTRSVHGRDAGTLAEGGHRAGRLPAIRWRFPALELPVLSVSLAATGILRARDMLSLAAQKAYLVFGRHPSLGGCAWRRRRCARWLCTVHRSASTTPPMPTTHQVRVAHVLCCRKLCSSVQRSSISRTCSRVTC